MKPKINFPCLKKLINWLMTSITCFSLAQCQSWRVSRFEFSSWSCDTLIALITPVWWYNTISWQFCYFFIYMTAHYFHITTMSVIFVCFYATLFAFENWSRINIKDKLDHALTENCISEFKLTRLQNAWRKWTFLMMKNCNFTWVWRAQ